MKYLILLCLLALFTSCSESKSIKIISTGERGYVEDWNNLYKTGDTVIVYQTLQQNRWRLDTNWSTKKDTIIYTSTFRVAVITKN